MNIRRKVDANIRQAEEFAAEIRHLCFIYIEQPDDHIRDKLEARVVTLVNSLRSAINFMMYEFLKFYVIPYAPERDKKRYSQRNDYPLTDSEDQLNKVLSEFIDSTYPGVVAFLRAYQPYTLDILEQFRKISNFGKHTPIMDVTPQIADISESGLFVGGPSLQFVNDRLLATYPDGRTETHRVPCYFDPLFVSSTGAVHLFLIDLSPAAPAKSTDLIGFITNITLVIKAMVQEFYTTLSSLMPPVAL